MKASDYIVEYLIGKGITDVFGYPGGMVTHLMDSLSKYQEAVHSHVTYHEQGAAFAACGYAQASGKVGVAYATSGPGATNLITGICNAFFDSIPAVFITGQVNTFEAKGEYAVRQRGFQETDIVTIIRSVTKYAARVEDADKLKWYLDYAFHIAQDGRKGPVLLDIPMNIFRAEIEPIQLEGYSPGAKNRRVEFLELRAALHHSQRPVLLIGSGAKNDKALLRTAVERLKIPAVTTMLAVDTIENNYGFVGAYGSRTANFVVAKSDLVISLGARLDVRQVGAKRDNFAPQAKIVRVDIDEGELSYKVHEDEIQIAADVADVLKYIETLEVKDYTPWIQICNAIKERLQGIDDRLPNILVKSISKFIPEYSVVTTDVGQNQVWVSQSFEIKHGQRLFFSGGHGAMGYSLPAAIGCAVATQRPVYSFNGDGGLQMNIQELQTIVREQLPVKIVLFNNFALGMIRHFQEMYFQSNYFETTPKGGYTVPDFEKIASAYGIPYRCVRTPGEINEDIFSMDGPQFIELKINEPTHVFPKLEFGKPNQDQEPLIDRKLYKELMELNEEMIMK